MFHRYGRGRHFGHASSGGGGSTESYDYFVSTATGASDTNNGQSSAWTSGQNGPFVTIMHAIDVAGAALSGTGKVISVLPGIYNQAVTNTTSTGGTSWTNKIRITAHRGSTAVWLRPSTAFARVVFFDGLYSYMDFDGINLDGSNVPFGSFAMGTTDTSVAGLPHHISLRNAEVIGNKAGFASNAGTIEIGNHRPGGQGGFNLSSLVIHGGEGYGVYVATADSTVEHCEIYDMKAEAGIQIYNGGGDSPNNNVVRDNWIHDMTQTEFFEAASSRAFGIVISGRDNRVYNNLIDHNDFTAWLSSNGLTLDGQSAGIYVLSGSSNLIAFNTIANNAYGGIRLDSGAGQTIVRNNLLYKSTAASSAYSDGGTGTVEDHNMRSEVDPLFVNSASSNYHLQAGSSALSTGVAISGITTDKDGTSRANPPTIGAFEH